MTSLLRHAGVSAICALVATLLAVPPAQAGPGAPATASAPGLIAARAGGCADVAVLVVDRHGKGWSGTTSSAAPELRPGLRALTSRASALGRTVQVRHLGLDVAAAGSLAPREQRHRSAMKRVTPQRARAWFRGVAAGTSQLGAEVSRQVTACPEQAYVLAGHEQGSSVAHRLLVALDANPAVAGRVVGALLLSDGDRRAGTRATVLGGRAASAQARGVVTRKLTRTADVPGTGLAVPVYSVCNEFDIVCDLRGRSVKASLAAHASYGDAATRAAVTGAARALATRATAWPRAGEVTVTTTPGADFSQQLPVSVGSAHAAGVVFELGSTDGLPAGASATLSPAGLLTGSVPAGAGGSWTLTYSVRGTDPATTPSTGTVTVVANATTATSAVGAGGEASCRVDAEGSAWCVGDNAWGQLGVGDNKDKLRPQRVGPVGVWRSVSTSGGTTCGVRATTDLYCWGMNSSGQLGIGDQGQKWRPERVGGSGGWASVATGWTTTCAIKTNRTLWCWGGNSAGQLGIGTKAERRVPTKVGSASNWATVTVGGWHVCATKANGKAFCWGRNDLGQLGTGSTGARLTPTAVAGGGTWARLDAGWSSTCGLTTAGEARCWGLNDMGQVGDGTKATRLAPTAVSGGRTYTSVSLGDAHACGLDTSGAAWCWGSNRYGQLGTLAQQPTNAPVRVAGGTTWSDLDTGWMHTCGLSLGDELQCWGGNEQGQLGQGNRVARATPPGVRAPAPRRVRAAPDGRLVITSFNVLGSQHTQPGGGTPSYAPGRIRTEWATNLLTGKGADIVAFQELQHDQYRQLGSALGDTYSFYPENTTRSPKVVWQSIMWRTSEWELVDAEDVWVPVIGKTRPNPIIRLRNRQTGRHIWVFNVHNSSKQTKERQQERNRAVKIEIKEIKERRPNEPVVFLGDMNERRPVFCKVTGQTDLRAVNGGTRTKSTCTLPPRPHIDWIFASPELAPRNHAYERNPMTARITDHSVLTGVFGF